MSVSKEKIKTCQPLLEGRDWLGSPAKREVLEAHSHPFLQTIKSAGGKEEEKKEERYSGRKENNKVGKKKEKKKGLEQKTLDVY